MPPNQAISRFINKSKVKFNDRQRPNASGVDFTNILQAVFVHAQIPKEQNDIDDLTIFLHFWDLHS